MVDAAVVCQQGRPVECAAAGAVEHGTLAEPNVRYARPLAQVMQLCDQIVRTSTLALVFLTETSQLDTSLVQTFQQ